MAQIDKVTFWTNVAIQLAGLVLSSYTSWYNGKVKNILPHGMQEQRSDTSGVVIQRQRME